MPQTGRLRAVRSADYNGIVYDARKLLEDVARMVEDAKQKPAVTSSR